MTTAKTPSYRDLERYVAYGKGRTLRFREWKPYARELPADCAVGAWVVPVGATVELSCVRGCLYYVRCAPHVNCWIPCGHVIRYVCVPAPIAERVRWLWYGFLACGMYGMYGPNCRSHGLLTA